MSIAARFFRWHRRLAWLVGLQVLAWVAGGFVFTWLPFQAWVKAEDAVRRPVQALPDDWAASLAALGLVLTGATLALLAVRRAAGSAGGGSADA